jgi:8-oxo-dGTP pyrophosphatase MutT (NUDIX family)
MPISEWLARVRSKIGPELVVVPAATGLVFDDQQRLLVVRHSNRGVWVTPGGAVDPDESPVDAVVREVWEETGLTVEPIALRAALGGPEFRVRYTNGDEVSYVITVFECRRLAGTARPDGVETLEVRWVAAPELAQLELSRWARAALPHLGESRGTVWLPRPTWRPPLAE